MELLICEFCGTQFDASLPQCPLCGKTAVYLAEAVQTEPERPRHYQPSKPGKHLAPRQKKAKKGKRLSAPKEPRENPYKLPRRLVIAICVVLGLAVILGAVLAIYNLKWLDPIESPFRAKPAAHQPEHAEEETPQTPVVHTQPSEQDYTNEEDFAAQNPDFVTPATLVECTGLKLSTGTVTFDEPDLFYNITYTRSPEDCNQEVYFSSSDESIVTVNQQGKIVAVNAGVAYITAACGVQSASCLVTCDFAYLEEQPEEKEPTEGDPDALPELNNADMTFFSPGEQYQLEVRNLPEGSTVTFSCSNTAVATVTPGGLVTAKGSGTTTVTASLDDGQTLSCIVRCNMTSSVETADGSTCTLSHSDVTMSIVGEYFKLSLKDSAGKAIPGLAWVSSDEYICTVSADGIVTATGKGTAYVSTTYGGKSFECIVRCNIR